MSDEMNRTWLARGLPQYLKEVVFYAEGMDMAHLEERLKKREEFQAFLPDATLEEVKEPPKKEIPPQKKLNTKWGGGGKTQKGSKKDKAPPKGDTK